jgi:uncharacterized membrane protein
LEAFLPHSAWFWHNPLNPTVEFFIVMPEAKATTANHKAKSARLAYVDWMRGLACLLMFQTHCYDSWLNASARHTNFFMWSQAGGTFPAPLFLFLAGISFALVTDKLRRRLVPAREIAAQTIRRGAEILGFGLLFRLQQFAFNWRWAPWTDLLRVDVLNTIGVSMMLMGVACWIAGDVGEKSSKWASPAPGGNRVRVISIGLAMAIAAAISLLTPPLWTTHRLRWLPWPLESYINGVHTFGEPKGYFFPIFPWTGFAFAGLAIGFVLLSDFAKRNESAVFAGLGALGTVLIAAGRWFDHSPRQIYAVYSFWTTSPEFFLIRIGMLLIIMLGVYVWCRWGAAQWGWSPVIQLGQTSLLVYWVHIEFVYGRMIILPSHSNSIRTATYGLLFIIFFMLILSLLRTSIRDWKPVPGSWLSRWRRAAGLVGAR